jgi:4'-phosphopantetheinyl transferase
VKRLHPVILSVPEETQNLSPRERVIYLSRHARRALELSARLSGASPGPLTKNADGAPLPSNGVYWCVTHKPLYVGGVVSVCRIGMDIEQLRPFHPGLYKKVACDAEWRLSDEDRFDLFFRFWTAKEAVIKALGTGLRDLLNCRVVEIQNKTGLVIRIGGETFEVEHRYFDHHLASVVKNGADVLWRICDFSDDSGSGFSQEPLDGFVV